jgi:hypothetical protein
MSKVWKWILGILIVLVVVALAVGAVFLVRNRALMATAFRPVPLSNGQTQPNIQGTPNAPGTNPNPNGQRGPTMPFGFNNRRNPMNGFGWRGPMMGGRGFEGFGGFMPFGMFGMGFFFLGGLLRLILPLGVLATVAFIFYQMGKRAGALSANSQTLAPAPSEPAPADPPAKGRKVAKS